MIRIETNTRTINWPQNRYLSDSDILNATGAIATADDGRDLTDDIHINTHNVNSHKPGRYPIELSVTDYRNPNDYDSITVDAIVRNPVHREDLNQAPNQSSSNYPNNSSANQSQHKHHKKALLIGLIVLLVLVLGLGLRACHNQRAQTQADQNKIAQQSSQIAQNSSSIKNLKGQNAALNRQVAKLRSSVNQYQKDKDQNALQNRLNTLEQENQQLKNTPGIGRVNDAIQGISAHPDQAQNYLDQLPDSNTTQSWLGNVENQIQNWLNEHGDN